VATEKQAADLERFDRPPFVHAVVIGWSASRNALYIGRPEQPLASCRFVVRPARLDSSAWAITELLGKWHHDRMAETSSKSAAASAAAREAWAWSTNARRSTAGRDEPHVRLRRRAPRSEGAGEAARGGAVAEVVPVPRLRAANGRARRPADPA